MKPTYVYVLYEQYDEWYEGVFATLKAAKAKHPEGKWVRFKFFDRWEQRGNNTVWYIRRERLR